LVTRWHGFVFLLKPPQFRHFETLPYVSQFVHKSILLIINDL